MKTYFKYISAILFLALIVYGSWWTVGVIWLRPSQIDIYFQRIALEFATTHPEKASYLDMPHVELVTPYHSFLDEGNPMTPLGQPISYRDIQQNLSGYRYDKLSDRNQFYYHMLSHWARSTEVLTPHLNRLFPLNHIDGIWPRFLYLMDVLHSIQTESDGVAYIDRLKRWEFKLEETLIDLNTKDPHTYIFAPYLIDSALHQLSYYSQLPVEEHPLYRSFARKAVSCDPTKFNEERAVTLLGEVARVIQENINPSLATAASFLEKIRNDSTDDLRLAQWISKYRAQSAYYEPMLRYYATMPVNSDSLFQAGIQILDSMELFLKFPNSEPIHKKELFSTPIHRSIYNSKRIRVEDSLIRKMDSLYENIMITASGLFEVTPQVPMQFKYYHIPIPYASNYLYQFLPRTSEEQGLLLLPVQKHDPFDIQVITYACSFPGIHLLHASEWEYRDIPSFRYFLEYPAFDRGWALYTLYTLDQHLQLFSNQLVLQQRVYQELYMSLIRMLTDIGIHHKHWSLDHAKEFYTKRSSLSQGLVQEEINRICLQPGLYSADWIGYSQLQKLKSSTEERLGSNFVLQDFHNFILQVGSCPFPVLYKEWNRAFNVQ